MKISLDKKEAQLLLVVLTAAINTPGFAINRLTEIHDKIKEQLEEQNK